MIIVTLVEWSEMLLVLWKRLSAALDPCPVKSFAYMSKKSLQGLSIQNDMNVQMISLRSTTYSIYV